MGGSPVTSLPDSRSARPEGSTPPIGARLYAIIDVDVATEPLSLGRDVLEVGCGILQLRAKRLDDRAFVELGSALRDLCARSETSFVVNDRADIARLLRADGLHLGQNDLRVSDARQVVGRMQIGVSTHDPLQAREAERAGADLIAFGPVFETKTKEDPDPVVGLQSLGAVCKSLSTPVVAIGGINPENAHEAFRAGAQLVAAISALPSFLEGSAHRMSSKY